MGFVEFQNVSFSYNEGYEAQTRALENVSFSVESASIGRSKPWA